MGQEASVPAGVVGEDEDLEEQARAPPSSTNPPSPPPPPPPLPPSTAGGNITATTTTTTRTGSTRPAAKLMGAMFRTGGGGQHHQHQQQHHLNEDPHHYEGKELARAAAMGGNLYLEDDDDDEVAAAAANSRPEEFSYNNGGGVATYGGQGGPTSSSSRHEQQQHEQQPYYPQQQQHHHQQQQHQKQETYYHAAEQYYASSSNAQQQYPSGGGLQHHHSPQHHLAANNEPSSSSSSSSHNQPVAVMYEKTPTSPGSTSTNANKPRGGGIFASGRASGRGAALINSMRNLSLGGALRPGGGKQQHQQHAKQQQQHQQHHQQHEINDWEKQWDEDEDDDEEEEEEEEEDETTMGQQQAAAHLKGLHPLHQVRPGMDMGYSSSQTAAAAAASQMASAASSVVPRTPPKGQAAAAAAQYATTVSPDGTMPPTTPTPVDLLSRPLVEQWETAPGVGAAAEELKPNVQMFLPMLRVLGKGSFGKVVLVQKRVGKERGQLFAMKILRKTHLVKRRQIERTRTERKVLSVVNHPFIMKLHYAFQSEDKLYLVLDYCPGGELFFHLSRYRRFPERVARFYSAELLLAIGHLHKRGIIYRDLKPENVLLDADGHVKLGDFGLAKAGIKHPFEGATSMCGTPEYMAPEVLAQQGHGFCVDYWGLGMLLYEMMTGLPPWYTTDRAKLFRRLKSAPLDIPSYFGPQSADCVSVLLERNPRRRLGVNGIRTAMEHDFFRNISWRSLYARRVEPPIRPCEGWKPPEAVDENDPVASRNNYGEPMTVNRIEHMDTNELDVATQNFDNSFTRMPVESEDSGREAQEEDAAAAAELRADTFLGFSFDGNKDRVSPDGPALRHRTQQHYANQAAME